MMTEGQLVYLIGGIVIFAVVVLGVLLIRWDLRRQKKRKEESPEELSSRRTEGEVKTVHAVVADMVCGVKTVGHQAYKQPKAEKHFVIRFRDDDGNTYETSVSEEIYLGFEVGLAGELTLIDGVLFGFLPDGAKEGGEA